MHFLAIIQCCKKNINYRYLFTKLHVSISLNRDFKGTFCKVIYGKPIIKVKQFFLGICYG